MSIMRSRLVLGAVIIASVATLAGCGGGGGSQMNGSIGARPMESVPTTPIDMSAEGKWTILVYMDADNNLEQAAIANLNSMETVGSTQDVKIVVQVDRSPGNDTTNDDWTDTRRYLITKDSSSLIKSRRLDADAPLGEKDMGDWQTLQEFVQWGQQNCPAENYCLVIWDHGNGWFIRSAGMPQSRFVAVDDTSQSAINITDIPQALQGAGLSIIAFDACLMQQLEVGYQLKDVADYMVASAATVPGTGLDYAGWLAAITSTTGPEDLCSTMISEYVSLYEAAKPGITMSAIRLDKIAGVATAVSGIADVFIANAAAYGPALKIAREGALNYSTITAGDEDFYSLDLADYCAISLTLGADGVNASAQLTAALGEAVVANGFHADTPDACGLAIYMPPPDDIDAHYPELLLAQDTNWDEWMAAQTQ